MARISVALTAGALLLATISQAQQTKPQAQPAKPQVQQAKAPAQAKPQLPPATPNPAPIVQQWMRGLSLRDRVAQLISMACFGEAPATRSRDYQKFRHWVSDLHIGGLIVNNRVVQGQV